MLLNYLKFALRNILRNKSFSLINIAGLTIGLTTFLAISLYVVDEFSYDRFHANADRIHRAIISANYQGQVMKWGAAPNLLVPTAAKEIPEVDKAARYFHHNFGDLAFISNGTEQFSETELFFADPELFDIFTIPLIKGNETSVLSRKGTVVLSERAVKKYFGDTDPIGKVLKVDNKLDLEVTGIYQDFPSNSFLQANMIASFSSNWFGQDQNQSWGNASFDSFFLVHEGTSRDAANQKIEAMLGKNIPKEDRWFTIYLQPLLEVRLHSEELNPTFDRKGYGDMKQVRVLIALALIILSIAAINYMNLTTAQSQKRNKEVGINKTLGATFWLLSLKFYFEAAMFVFMSMCISLAAFILLLPLFNSMSGKEITIAFLSVPWFWLGFLAIWVILTILSGFYPAWYLSSFSPKSVLQKTSHSGGQAWVRKTLVVVQFASSIILIICSMVFYKQMNYISNKRLGYKPEQVIAVMVSAVSDKDRVNTLKTEFESLPEVKHVARSQSYPSIGTSGYTITREGTKESTSILTTRATHEVLDVLGIELLAGKTLPANKSAEDTTIQVVLNKAAIDYLGFTPEDAIGRSAMIFNGKPAEIVGVVKDFHFASMHQQISPYCFTNNTDNGYIYLLVKVETENLSATIDKLKAAFQKSVPAAFEYSFLDEQLKKQYSSERRLSNVMLLFACLAIFVACLGLYALSAFTAEQRTKEIGIRKVMGASVANLVGMLSRNFMVLVAIAFLIGIPAGYYIMEKWLEGFAYKTTIDVAVLLLAGAMSLAVAWLTVSFESFKAARSNPVNSLRSE